MKTKILVVLFTIISGICMGQKKTVEKQISIADVKFIDNKTVNLNEQSIFLNITETNNSIVVSAKGIKSTGVKGHCCVTGGKINYTNNSDNKPGVTPSQFATGIRNVKVILSKEPSGPFQCKATVNEDGSFGFPDVPVGVYTLLINDIVIAKNCLVTK